MPGIAPPPPCLTCGHQHSTYWEVNDPTPFQGHDLTGTEMISLPGQLLPKAWISPTMASRLGKESLLPGAPGSAMG